MRWRRLQRHTPAPAVLTGVRMAAEKVHNPNVVKTLVWQQGGATGDPGGRGGQGEEKERETHPAPGRAHSTSPASRSPTWRGIEPSPTGPSTPPTGTCGHLRLCGPMLLARPGLACPPRRWSRSRSLSSCVIDRGWNPPWAPSPLTCDFLSVDTGRAAGEARALALQRAVGWPRLHQINAAATSPPPFLRPKTGNTPIRFAAVCAPCASRAVTRQQSAVTVDRVGGSSVAVACSSARRAGLLLQARRRSPSGDQGRPSRFRSRPLLRTPQAPRPPSR